MEEYTLALKGLKMTYDRTTRRVKVNAEKMRYEGKGIVFSSRVTPILKDDIARVLGFNDGTEITFGEKMMSEYPATVTGGFHQMYVYSGIIQPQLHPDGNVSVLRTIAVNGKPSQEYLSRRSLRSAFNGYCFNNFICNSR